MESYWLLLAFCILVGLSLFGLFRLRARGAARGGDFSLAWIDDFSVARYKPMLRLLREADFAFLSAQPGYTPELGKKLRAERSRVFGCYLHSLSQDFHHLDIAARYAIVHSPEGVDVCGALARHRAVFAYAMTQVRVRLMLYRFGIGTVDVHPLLNALDEMTTEIRALRPVFDGAA